MKIVYIFSMLLFASVCFSQEAYNSCNSAIEICPNTTINVNNIGANKTLCGGCEDDFSFCFTPINSIWLTFTTDSDGGDVQINLNNPVFQTQAGQDNRFNATLIQANIPCNATSYTQIGNCINAAVGNQSITATGLVASTTYYIVLSGEQSGGGITLPAEFNIDASISGTAVDRPVPTINMGTGSGICKGDIVAIMADRTFCEDGGAFRWYINGNLVGVTITDSIFFTSELNNGNLLSVESNCFTTCPVTITQSLPPITVIDVIADAGPDATISDGGVFQINGIVGTNATIQWTPSYALSNDTIASPVANPNSTTTYTLHVTDTISHCTATDYVTITVDKGLIIPTTFTPNGDGINDTWEIIGIERYPDNFLNIYDRWGQLVFQSTGYNFEKSWNGEIKGGKLNEGVYFFEIQLRDIDKRVLNGSITLIR